jgi:high-affinity iron transporter
VWLGFVALLAVAALAAAALIPGSHTATGNDLARESVAAPSAQPHGSARVTKVFDSSVPARRYGSQVAAMENGVDRSGNYVSDLSPLPVAAFDRPVAEYRHYAERWAATLGHDVPPLTAALRARNRARARRAWELAFSDYLHLGAVYGLLPGDLDDRLAGLPGLTGDPHFVGLHRIEMGLWTNAPVHSLVGLATRLRAGVARLRAELPTLAINPKRASVRLRRGLVAVTVDPLDYVTRAHEILEDAQRDLMSGVDVPWSGQGVLGTAAGVAATRELLATLAPLMAGRGNAYATSEYWLGRLGAALESVRRADADWPSLRQLRPRQRQLIDGTLAGTLSALAQVPGTLETTNIPDIPNDPGSR